MAPPAAFRVNTPVGPAAVRLHGSGAGTVVLGHGAGGGVDAPDLQAAARAALERGWAVALVEQPWRVAGRRVAEAPPRLDAAWTAVVEHLRDQAGTGPLVLGGRSAGARVACRTADRLGAAGLLCLAFPLVPPGGRSRAGELAAPAVPRLVVQGARDSFGVPEPSPGVAVHVVPGADHGFGVRRRDGRSADEVADEVRHVVGRWLGGLTGGGSGPPGQTLT